MRQNITLKHIAKKVGVSVATVSRVLNGTSEKYRISSRTQANDLFCFKEYR